MRFFTVLFWTIFFQIFLTSCPRDTAPKVDLWVAVPQNSAIVIQIDDFQSLTSQIKNTPFFAAADSLPAVSSFQNRLRELSGFFEKDSLSNFLNERPAIAAIALSGAEKFDVLWLEPASLHWEKKLSQNLVNSYHFSKRNYADAELWTFAAKDSSGSDFYFCSHQNIWLISGNRALLEAGIRQMASASNLLQNADFQKLKETAAPKDLANVYVNFAEAQPLFQKWFPNSDASFLKKMGTWAELDLQLEENALLLTGLTLAPRDAPYYLQCLQNIAPQESVAAEIIPLNTGIWISMTFGNAEQFYRNYRDYLKKDGRLRRHNQLLKQVSQVPENVLLNWVDTEMGTFSFNGLEGQNRSVAYFKCRSEKAAQSALDSISDLNFIEGYRGIIIKKIKPENALPRFYGRLFEDFYKPYFAVAEGFAFFANDLTVLKGVLNDVLDSKTFGKDAGFLKFNQELPDRQHLSIFASTPAFLPWIGANLSSENFKILKENQAALKTVSWSALQLKVSDDAVFTNFYAGLFPNEEQASVVRQWSTPLKNPAVGTPQFLKNHLVNQLDIAIQDEKNNLYLLQNDGKILWAIPLDGKILGEIHQVDFYKNRKLQMVFNTENSLYVLDRLGRNVENFPLKFPKKATAPMAVFDYADTRDYRMVVPIGSSLKNYDKNGKEVSGWNFKKISSPIIAKPQHFSYDGKDVILAYAKNGEILLLNRRGEKRVKNIDRLPNLLPNFYFRKQESFENSEILSISKLGRLVTLQLNGKADSLFYEDDLTAEHFLFFDEKMIFTSDKNLYLKDDENPWNIEFENAISDAPKAMILNGKTYIAAYSRRAEEIRIFDSEGNLLSGFPVFSQGAFDMGSLKRNEQINIITYSEDGTVICYLLQ